jgi:hypothetical protein
MNKRGGGSIRRRAKKCLLFGLLFSLFFSSSVFLSQDPSSFVSASSKGNNSNRTTSQPVYIWFFGYVGNTFYPEYQLNLSQKTMISLAKNLSQTFGRKNLVMFPVVDETRLPGGTINSSMIPKIRSYVSSLKQYAAQVYGRLTFLQFNLTSPETVYNQSSLYINELGLNGIWFDNPSNYYYSVGNKTFNDMMQNLTTKFPDATFILNGVVTKYGYIVPLPGYTWEEHTYLAPSPPQGSLTMNEKQIQQLYDLYPGHLIGHFDASGPPPIGDPESPMSLFANLSSSQEISTLTSFAASGARPTYPNETYATLVPIIGAWTYNGSLGGADYHGTLYNSLSAGGYPRSTFETFERIISNFTAVLSISSGRGNVGEEVSLSGSNYSPLSKVKILFDGRVLETANTNSSGGFTSTFIVPPSTAGPHNVSVTDRINSLSLKFVVFPKIIDNPKSGKVGTKAMIAGSGFASYSKVRITLRGIEVTGAVTDKFGSFGTSFLVPNHLRPGNYTVRATDSRGHTAFVIFKVT